MIGGSPRYAKSLWSYNPIPNGCVLYLPLWALGGPKFKSVDSYRHECAVTGATRGIAGRVFAGDNDYISCGNGASLQILGAITIISWMKNDVTDNQAIASKWDSAGNQRAYVLWTVGTKLRLTISSALTAGVAVNVDSTNNIVADTWTHCAGVFIPSTSQKVYLNGVLDNTNTTTIPASIANSSRNLASGADYSNSATPNANWLAGTVGEVLIYNRALSALEVMSNYQATKGRYL